MHELVNVYLHRFRGPDPVLEILVDLEHNRGYKALIRYVRTYRERETLFMLAAMARKPTARAKLPLDLVKHLAAMVLGEHWNREATQAQIAAEGRWEEAVGNGDEWWDEDHEDDENDGWGEDDEADENDKS
jgi:hypothetical protein